MTGPPLLWLILIFVVTSAISVVTGSTSLITVPAMLQFHIEPRTALATNMFALTFMSVGGAFPFLRGHAVDRGRLPLLTALTLAGSVIEAFLLLLIPNHSVPIIAITKLINFFFGCSEGCVYVARTRELQAWPDPGSCEVCRSRLWCAFRDSVRESLD